MCTVLRREYIFLYSREEMYMYKKSPCTLCTTISLHSLSFCTQTSWKAPPPQKKKNFTATLLSKSLKEETFLERNASSFFVQIR